MSATFLLQSFVYCFFACFFFGILLHAPMSANIIGAFLGAVGYDILLFFNQFSQPAGFFFGALFIAVCSSILARKLHAPVIVFLTPAIVSLVPGIGLYQSMAYFVLDDITEGVNMAVKTLINAGALAFAMALTLFFVRVTRRTDNNIHNNINKNRNKRCR